MKQRRDLQHLDFARECFLDAADLLNWREGQYDLGGVDVREAKALLEDATAALNLFRDGYPSTDPVWAETEVT